MGRNFKYIKRPQPIMVDDKKYCKWCYEQGILTEIHHKSFLCKNCMKEYKKDYNLERQRKIRNSVEVVILPDGSYEDVFVNRENDVYTLLGTSDFSSHYSGNPENESRIVKNELNSMLNYGSRHVSWSFVDMSEETYDDEENSDYTISYDYNDEEETVDNSPITKEETYSYHGLGDGRVIRYKISSNSRYDRYKGWDYVK